MDGNMDGCKNWFKRNADQQLKCVHRSKGVVQHKFLSNFEDKVDFLSESFSAHEKKHCFGGK
jgi:hypothetical protein